MQSAKQRSSAEGKRRQLQKQQSVHVLKKSAHERNSTGGSWKKEDVLKKTHNGDRTDTRNVQRMRGVPGGITTTTGDPQAPRDPLEDHHGVTVMLTVAISRITMRNTCMRGLAEITEPAKIDMLIDMLRRWALWVEIRSIGTGSMGMAMVVTSAAGRTCMSTMIRAQETTIVRGATDTKKIGTGGLEVQKMACMSVMHDADMMTQSVCMSGSEVMRDTLSVKGISSETGERERTRGGDTTDAK